MNRAVTAAAVAVLALAFVAPAAWAVSPGATAAPTPFDAGNYGRDLPRDKRSVRPEKRRVVRERRQNAEAPKALARDRR